MQDLTALQRDALFVIAGFDDRPNGLAIKTELEEYYDRDMNHGQLYPNLDTLVAKGLVQKEPIDRRSNAYTLTKRGARVLRERHAWEHSYLDGAGADAPTP